MKRAIVIVLDGCGAGEAPDAAKFGDLDHPATIKHVWEKAGPLNAPTLQSCGFFTACKVPIEVHAPQGKAVRYGRLQELNIGGKDSVAGHWEMLGIVTNQRFPTYPNGFPADLVQAVEKEIGHEVLGNKPASGTEIIKELGAEHMRTKKPILYTSADSVFQIACHEEIVPIEELYKYCRIARRLCQPPNNVERVIARPFIGDAQNGFQRTERRKDFPLSPPHNLADEIGDVYGIGVVPELFDQRGFRHIRRTQNNKEHGEMLFEALKSDARFIFANFEDTDMLFGHRNDPVGFGGALEKFDLFLATLLPKLTEDDILILTADHGNDPTSISTDHSREYVPACVISAGSQVTDNGDVKGMAAIGATVAAHLGVDWKIGQNLLHARLAL
jgi:phosphopentomutase